MKKLLVLSGKGGTGKTTLTSAFIDFGFIKAVADCDVDAPNLHLVTKCNDGIENDFYGLDKAYIDTRQCVKCGKCANVCEFSAIKQSGDQYIVDDIACEGCMTCQIVCPSNAISSIKDISGKTTLFTGKKTLSTARLKTGRGNSGKLVSEVKKNLFKNTHEQLAIIDGSPGIGCPVIASINGVDYVIIVSEPTVSGLSDLERIAQICQTFGTGLGICVNKSDLSPSNTQHIKNFAIKNNIEFLGEIPYDMAVSNAINNGHSIATVKCPAQFALKNIFDKVIKWTNKTTN